MRSAITIAAAALLLTTGMAWADTLRVPKDHATIQGAIDAAAPGDTILVSSGKYLEAVDIDKSGIELKGKGNAQIEPPGNEHGIGITDVDDVTVSGFKIIGGDLGVHIERCNRIVVTKCRISDTADAGIRARASADVDLSSCRIDDPGGDGVELGNIDRDSGDTSEPVDGGSLTKIRVKGAGDQGVSIVGKDITLLKCRSDTSNEDGIEIRGDVSTNVVVERCVVIRSITDECFVSHSPGTKFIRCSANIGDEEGFDLEGDGIEATDCKAKSCRRAFEIEDASNVKLTNCKGTKSREAGVLITGGNGCTLDGVKISKSGTDGIHLTNDSSNNTIRNSKAKKSTLVDLRDDNGTNDVDENNKFKTTLID